MNLPEHSDNPVHTDEGARAAGHERALVAGTTVFVYLTHPVIAAWGADWVERGGGEVRFRSPVFDDDLVDLVPVGTDDGGHRIDARSRSAVRATFDVWNDGDPPGPMRGERLPAFAAPLDESLIGYPTRVGDPIGVGGAVHPALTAVIGNRAMIASVVDGPWIHVRSHITHQGIASPGAVAVVESSIADRFDSRAGARVVLDVRVTVDDRPVWAIEHEAIVRLA